MMNEGVIIAGARNHGRMIRNILRKTGHSVVGFVDDAAELKDALIDGLPVLGTTADIDQLTQTHNLNQLAIGFSDAYLQPRATFFNESKSKGRSFPNVIDPKAIIDDEVKIGEGVFIAPGVVVNFHAEIQDNVVIYSSAIVDHDSIIERDCWLGPGVHLAGSVSIGRGSFVGTGATVITGKRVGAGSVIGAGAVVINDIPDGVLAVGVPAKVIRTLATTNRFQKEAAG